MQWNFYFQVERTLPELKKTVTQPSTLPHISISPTSAVSLLMWVQTQMLETTMVRQCLMSRDDLTNVKW